MTPRIALLVCLALPGMTCSAGDALEAFLSTDPVVEARRSFESGDRRHLVIPVCQAQVSEAMPGWPLEGPTPPEMWAALEKGRRPFRCTDLGDGPGAANFLSLLKYAERYNRTLLDLEKSRRENLRL